MGMNNPAYNAHKMWLRITHRSTLYMAKYGNSFLYLALWEKEGT